MGNTTDNNQQLGSARILIDLSTDGNDKTIFHGEITGNGMDLLYLLASLFENRPEVLSLLKDGITAHASYKENQSQKTS